MTVSEEHVGVLIGIPEIADVAGVQRTAVSNWRKRNLDFPAPVIDTPSGILFDLGEVESWLIESGKISHRVPIVRILWPILDTLRGDLSVEDYGSFIGSALVYLELSDRIDTGRMRELDDVRPNLNLTWGSMRLVDPKAIHDGLRSAVSKLEELYPEVRGLMVDGLFPGRGVSIQSAIRSLDLLDRVSAEDETPRFALFEEMRDRTHERDRFSEEWATPASLELLMARLSTNAMSIMDPACGEGGVLLMAAVIDTRLSPESVPTLYGCDVNQRAIRLARTRCFLYDIDANIEIRNSLRDPLPQEKVDAVVLDPPFGMNQWGDAAIYMSERWRYGTPSPNSADMAWLQMALEPLAQEGRAYVLLPAGSMFRSGQDEKIRRSMLEAGVVEALIHLPARLRRDTSIPMVLWCLRSESAQRPDDVVLLIDASRLGTAGRSTVTLEEDEVDSLVSILNSWSSRIEFEVEQSTLNVVQIPSTMLAEDGNLTPSHWYLPQPVDRSVLRAIREDALTEALAAEKKASAAMRELLTTLKADR